MMKAIPREWQENNMGVRKSEGKIIERSAETEKEKFK